MAPDVGNRCPHSPCGNIAAKLQEFVIVLTLKDLRGTRRRLVRNRVTTRSRSVTPRVTIYHWRRDHRRDGRVPDGRRRSIGPKRDVPAKARHTFHFGRKRECHQQVCPSCGHADASRHSHRDRVITRSVTQSSHTVCLCNQLVFGPLPSPGFIGFDIERIDLRGQCDSVRPEVRAVPRTTLFASGSQRRLERRLLSCYRCKTTT
jgi:hypothetical protein